MPTHIGTQPGAHTGNNVISFLAAHQQAIPERPALLWLPPDLKAAWMKDRSTDLTHTVMPYAELMRAVSATACGLRQLGIRKGDRVFVFIPMSPQLYIAMFAVQQLGAVAVVLDSWARAEQLGQIGRAHV